MSKGDKNLQRALQKKLHQEKRHYAGVGLNFADSPEDPLPVFIAWLDEALQHKDIRDANAMCLTTVGKDKNPHSRMVLLKNATEEGLSFYTNYDSAKGKQIAANPQVALNFWWPQLFRQVRIEGEASKLGDDPANEYFATRDRGSRIAAIASPQSRRIGAYSELEQKVAEIERDLHNKEVLRPKNWGGYLVKAKMFEFWEGRESRLHYRIVYRRLGGDSWDKIMLAP